MAAMAWLETPRPGKAWHLSVAVLSQEQNLASLSCCLHPEEVADEINEVTGSICWLPPWQPHPPPPSTPCQRAGRRHRWDLNPGLLDPKSWTGLQVLPEIHILYTLSTCWALESQGVPCSCLGHRSPEASDSLVEPTVPS